LSAQVPPPSQAQAALARVALRVCAMQRCAWHTF
jgi:hypothetical protein